MIIELHNFGPIERFTFDTEKQMYFIFGENNVGKSYAISAVYLILKNWKKAMESIPLIEMSDWHLKIFKENLEDLELDEIDLENDLNNITETFINSCLINNLMNSFSNSFSSVGELFNKYSRESFSITIRDTHFSLILGQNKNNSSLLSFHNLIFTTKHILLKSKNKQFHFYEGSAQEPVDIFLDQIAIKTKANKNDVLEFFNKIFRNIYTNRINNNFYFLPASRSGIYNGLSAFSAIIVQLTQLRNQIPNYKFDIPTLSEPISDYFLNISTINGKGYSTPFSNFAKKIEDKIIKGKISFDKSERKLYYEPEKLDLSLELSQASSMISEIAPIIAHLKFILNNADGTENYLFIEEPEAHLHPKIQVELMKLFAELAGNGLHIIMTSHSNYLFNKLSNMVLAKEIDPETISVCLMRMGKNGSFVDENAMNIDEDGIDDDNFADTAEELYSERLKLYEQNL